MTKVEKEIDEALQNIVTATDWLGDTEIRHMTAAKILSRIAIAKQDILEIISRVKEDV